MTKIVRKPIAIGGGRVLEIKYTAPTASQFSRRAVAGSFPNWWLQMAESTEQSASCDNGEEREGGERGGEDATAESLTTSAAVPAETPAQPKPRYTRTCTYVYGWFRSAS